MLEFWSKFEFIQKIFKKEEQTGKIARDRLRLVLIHDRASFSPQLMEALREDLIRTITRYMEIDSDNMEMGLERKDGAMALAASIPVIKIKTTFSVSPQNEEEAPLKIPEEEKMPPAPKIRPMKTRARTSKKPSMPPARRRKPRRN